MGKSKNNIISEFLKEILNLFKIEIKTGPGKVNLLFDLLAFALAIIFILGKGFFDKICDTIVSIATKNAPLNSDGSAIVVISIVIGFFVICLLFMHITQITEHKFTNGNNKNK